MVFLETERLIFRSHATDDEQSFIRMQMDPLVRRFVGGSPWSEERARMRFRTEYLGQPTNHNGLWATVLKSENIYIGHCGICAREKPTEVRLAYYIAQPYWNRGYATEAARAFLALAFVKLGFERVVADLAIGNAAAVRVLEKLGFVLHGSEEIRGHVFHNYELTRDRWSPEPNHSSQPPPDAGAAN